MFLACLECAQRAGTPESLAAPTRHPVSAYQCETCRTQWRRSAWGLWQSEDPAGSSSPRHEASPYWPYA